MSRHNTDVTALPVSWDNLPQADVAKVIAAAEDYMARLERGEQLDHQAFLQSHADICEPLAQCLDNLELLQNGGAQLRLARGSELPEPLPEAIGDYRIIREIGRGGMGIVYEAEQLSLARKVALKVLPFAGMLDQRQLARFKTEAQAAAQLHHTNIVPVFAVGCERGVHYYAMQYIEGQTLTAVVRELRRQEHLQEPEPVPPSTTEQLRQITGGLSSGGQIPAARPSAAAASPQASPAPAQVAASGASLLASEMVHGGSSHTRGYFRAVAHLGIQAAEALEHAHLHGVVHRDINPSNLMVDVTGNLWITDFGLAIFRHEADGQTLTMPGDLLGTLRYMSPEQALATRATVDHRTDIYSLGVTLYELLTLRPAFNGRDRQELLRQVAEQHPEAIHRRNPQISVDLETIIQKAMAKEAQDRYQTAQQMADDLRRFLSDTPILARRPSLLKRTEKWCRRHKAVVWSSVAMLVVVIAGLAISSVLLWRAQLETETALVETKRQQHRTAAQTAIAEQQELAARRHLYSARIDRIQQHLQQHQIGPALQLLEAQRLPPGQDLRGFEWYNLWRRANAGLRTTIRAHVGGVTGIAYLPDGRLVSSGKDGTVRIWDVATGEATVLTASPRGDAIESVAVTRDGKTIATGDAAGLIRLWDAATGRPGMTLYGHLGAVEALAFSGDGKAVASANYSNLSDRHLLFWNATTGRQTHKQAILSLQNRSTLETSPDGTHLAFSDQRVAIWDWDKEQRDVVREEGENFSAVAFSPDGMSLAVVDRNAGSVSIWDIASRKTRCEVPMGVDALSLAFSRDGQVLAIGRNDGTIALWDPARNTTRYYGHAETVSSIAFSPDGQTFASASQDGSIRIWDPATDWRSDSSAAATAQGGRYIGGFAISPDGRWIAHGDWARVRLFSAATMKHIRDLKTTQVVHSVAFSPDSRLLAASGQWDPLIHIWNVETGRPLTALAGHHFGVGCVAFFADGRHLVSGGSDHTVRIWELERPQAARTIAICTGPVRAVAVSPDGRTVAAAHDRPVQIRVLDVATGQERGRIPGDGSAAFLSDGTLVTCGANAVRLWRAPDLQEQMAIPRSGAAIRQVACPVKGSMAATTNHDGSITIWDLQGGWERATLSPPKHNAQAVAICADGNIVASRNVGEDSPQITVFRAATERDVLAQSAVTNPVIAQALERARHAGTLAASNRAQAMEHYSDAAAQLRSVLDAGNSDQLARGALASVCMEWARLLRESGLPRDAAQIYQEALDAVPESPIARMGLARALLESGQSDAAIDSYQLALGKTPEDAVAHWQASDDLANRSGAQRTHLSRASELAKRSLDLAGSDPMARRCLLIAEYRSGNGTAELAGGFDGLLALGVERGSNMLYLSMIYRQMGDHDQALRWYHAANRWFERQEPPSPTLTPLQREAQELLGNPVSQPAPGATLRNPWKLAKAKSADGGALSPDGNLLLATTPAGIGVYDLRSRSLLRELHDDRVTTYEQPQWSPDGKVVACGSRREGRDASRGEARVWLFDVKSGRVLGSVESGIRDAALPGWEPARCQFLQDGKLIGMPGSRDGSYEVWDTRTLSLRASIEGLGNQGVWSSELSSGRVLLVAGLEPGAVLWDLQTGEQVKVLKDSHVTGMSKDRKLLLIAGIERPGLRLWDPGTRQVVRAISHSPVAYASFSSDGRYIFGAYVASNESHWTAWEVATGKHCGWFDGHRLWTVGPIYLPYTDLAVSGTSDGYLCVWDLRRGHIVQNDYVHVFGIYPVAASPDGKLLVTRGDGVTLWDVVAPTEPVPPQDAPEREGPPM